MTTPRLPRRLDDGSIETAVHTIDDDGRLVDGVTVLRPGDARYDVLDRALREDEELADLFGEDEPEGG